MHRAPRLNALVAAGLLAAAVVLVSACSSAQTGSQGQWTFGPALAPSSAAPSGAAPASAPAVPSGAPAASVAPQPS